MNRSCEEEEDVISPTYAVDFLEEAEEAKEEEIGEEVYGAKSGGGRRSFSWGIVDQVKQEFY